MQLLDTQSIIDQRDPDGALAEAERQPQQLLYDFKVHELIPSPRTDILNVVCTGMGGSAFAAEFVTAWPVVRVPLQIVKNYTLPAYVGSQTLVVCASYSGNTEETLSAFDQAVATGATVVTLSRDGALQDKAATAQAPHIELPQALQPRMGVMAAYRALVEILETFQLVEQGSVAQLAAIVPKLEAAVRQWTPDVAYMKNVAKQYAFHMSGKTPIIYGSPLTYPIAYKWKIDCNENAKNTAWCGALPEFNHNEFVGWSSHPIEKPFAVFDLRSSYDHERISKRFEVSDRLLSGKRPKSQPVIAKGSSVVEQLMYLLILGDFATIYLAILNGVNPTPVDLVEKFKKEMAQN